MSASDRLLARLRVQRTGTLVTVTINGQLDANIGVELLAALSAEIEEGADRVDIDLLGIDGWTPEGARALRRSRSLARTVADGLHYRTGPGAGHDALLDAYADDEPDAVGAG